MPENARFWHQDAVLRTAEICRLLAIFRRLGIMKVRFTGGEPLVHPDFDDILAAVAAAGGVSVHITTNGVLLHPKRLELLQRYGVRTVNFSLDTLQAQTFFTVTRRHAFEKVWEHFQALLASGMNAKVNTVILPGVNTQEIAAFVRLTETSPQLRVRFIEQMPFNGGSGYPAWNWERILEEIETFFPRLHKCTTEPNSTELVYRIDGFLGTVGIIPAYSRLMCGQCNRVRVNAKGDLRNCLYARESLHLLPLLRQGFSDEEIIAHIRRVIWSKAQTGFAADGHNPTTQTMNTIGG